MKRTWKVLAGAVVAASLVIAPLAAASATDEAPIEETSAVVEQAPEQETQETPAEGPATEAPAPQEQASVEAPAPAPQVVAPQAAPEVQPMTEKKCEESGNGWQEKVEVNGEDSPTKAVTALDGFLIAEYCVKSSTDVLKVTVDPPKAEVTIDTTTKHGISHYQIRLVEKPKPEIPAPLSCVAAGDWYTEGDDIAPASTPEGLLFQDADPTKAVGIRVPVTGNLQGWAPVSFDATGGTEQFFFRIVVNLTEHGGPAYKSLSFPGYTTIDQNSVAYQTGKTIAAMAAEWPKAVITSVGFQTNSAAPADFAAVLKSVEGPCASLSFVPEVQEPNCTTVTGSQVLVGDGVLTVEGEWATDHIDVPFEGTLADIGTVLDIQADPIQYVGLHIDLADGRTIVFEEEPSYGGNLWSTDAFFGVEGGMGYAAFGSIEDFIAYSGDVQVAGIRLLYTHPTGGSTTVESFIIGCTEYTFREVPEQPADKVVTSEWSEPQTTCENEPLDVLTLTRTITTTPYVWDAESWEWVEGESTVVTEEVSHVVTSAELESLECPVTTPEPTPTPSTPAVKPTPAALAVTGGGDTGVLVPLAATLGSALGAVLIVIAAIRRRRSA